MAFSSCPFLRYFAICGFHELLSELQGPFCEVVSKGIRVLAYRRGICLVVVTLEKASNGEGTQSRR